LSTNLYWF